MYESFMFKFEKYSFKNTVNEIDYYIVIKK